MNYKYILKLFFCVLFFSVLLRISFDLLKNIKLVSQISEGFGDNMPKAFCDVNTGYNLEKKCNDLTQNNCNLTSCCVWMSGNKCKAGNENGPTFNTGTDGKSIPYLYFYFQNKCYGSKCPSNT